MASESTTESRAAPGPDAVRARLDELVAHQEALLELRTQRPDFEEEREALRADVAALEADIRATSAWLAWAAAALPEPSWRAVADDLELGRGAAGADRALTAAVRAVWSAFEARGDGDAPAAGPLYPRALTFHVGEVPPGLLARAERRFGPLHPDVTSFLAARLDRREVPLDGEGGARTVQRLLAQPGRLGGLADRLSTLARSSLLAAAVRFLHQAGRPGGLPVVGDPAPVLRDVLGRLAELLSSQVSPSPSLSRAPRDDHPLAAWLEDLAARSGRVGIDAARALGALLRRAPADDPRLARLLEAAERTLAGDATPSERSRPAALGHLSRHGDAEVAARAARLRRHALRDPDGPACAPAAEGLADLPPAGDDDASLDLLATLESLAVAAAPDVLRAVARVVAARGADAGRLDRLERLGRDVADRVTRGGARLRPLLEAWEVLVEALGAEAEPGRDALVRLRMLLAATPDAPPVVYLDRLARDAGLADPSAGLEPPPAGAGRGGAWAELRSAVRDLERVARRSTPGATDVPKAWRAAHRRVEVLGRLDDVPAPARAFARAFARAWAPPPSAPVGADFDLLSRAWEEAPLEDVVALDSPDPFLADAHLAGLEARVSTLAWLAGVASLQESVTASRRVAGMARDLLDALAVALVPPAGAPDTRSPEAQAVLAGAVRRLLETHPDLAARVAAMPDDGVPLRLAEPLAGVLARLSTDPATDPADAARLADALLEGALAPSPVPPGGRLEATARLLDHLLSAEARPEVLDAVAATAAHPLTRRLAASLRAAAEPRPVTPADVDRVLAAFPDDDGPASRWSEYLEERREAWRWVQFLLDAPALDPLGDLGAVREAFGPGRPPAGLGALAARLDAALDAARAQVPEARRAGALRTLVLERGPDGARTPSLRPALRPPPRTGPGRDPHAALADLRETADRVLRLVEEAGWTDLHLAWEGLVRSEEVRRLEAHPPPTDPRVQAERPLYALLAPFRAMEVAARTLRSAAIPLLAALGAAGAAWEAHLTVLADDLAGFAARLGRDLADPDAADAADPTTLLRRRLAFRRLTDQGAYTHAVDAAPECAGGPGLARAVRALHRPLTRGALLLVSLGAWLGVAFGLGAGAPASPVRCLPVSAGLASLAPAVLAGLALPVLLWLGARRRRRDGPVFTEARRLATPRWWAVHGLLTLAVAALVPATLLGLALGVLTALGGLLVLSARLEPQDSGPVDPDRAALAHWLLALQHAMTLAAAGLAVAGLYAPGCGGDFAAWTWALVAWPLASAGVACLVRAARPPSTDPSPWPPAGSNAGP